MHSGSYTLNPTGLTGFEVRIKDEISWPWQQCVCVNDPVSDQ